MNATSKKEADACVEEALIEDLVGGHTPKELYTSYDAWAKDRGFKPMNISTFGRRLTATGLKHRHSNGKKLWCVDFSAATTGPYPPGGFKGGQVGQVEKYSDNL